MTSSRNAFKDQVKKMEKLYKIISKMLNRQGADYIVAYILYYPSSNSSI